MPGDFYLVIVYAAFGTWSQLRRGSAAGLRELEVMDADRAGVVWDSYSSPSGTKLLFAGGALFGGYAVWLAIRHDLSAITSGLACLTILSAAVARRVVRPRVLSTLAARDLAPRSGEASARRRRKVRQIGGASLALFAASSLLAVVSRQTGSSALTVVTGILFFAWFLSLLAVAWAGAWRYGDETRTSVPRG